MGCMASFVDDLDNSETFGVDTTNEYIPPSAAGAVLHNCETCIIKSKDKYSMNDVYVIGLKALKKRGCNLCQCHL
jgi:hypothetical protein